MRRLTRYAAMLGICLIGVLTTAHADKTTTTTTKTVQRYDSGWGTPDCEFSGSGCTVTVTTTVETGSIISPSGGGFILQVFNTNMMGSVVRGVGPVFVPIVNRAIIFPSTTTVTINESIAYPTLNGRIIDISGIATNGNGGYTVSFLP